MEKNNLPRVTEVLRTEGISDFSHVPQDIMDRAQKFGNAVHKMTELWDKGILNIDILDKNLVPYLEAWKKFKTDYKIYIAPDDDIEKHFVSKKWGFCGTPDRIVYVGQKLTLIDIKSSTSMYASTELQTAAYQILVEENSTCKVNQRWGVQLKEDGSYKVEPYTEISDKTVFLSALNLYNWKKRKGLL